MILKYLLSGIFILLMIYSLIRPFSSSLPRIFLFSGSMLGFFSVLGVEYTNYVANLVGIGSGIYLYLYLGLVTLFIFIFYCLEKFKSIEQKILKLSRAITLKGVDKD